MRAVVTAAGEGVRLRPLTSTRPKHLLPIGGKPLLAHILTALKKSGFREVLLVVGYRGERIREVLGDGSSFGLKLSYVRQRGAYGTGGAVTFAKKFTGGKPFLLIYGDLYVEPKALKRIVQAFRKRRSEAVMAVMEVENPQEYGIVKLDRGGRVVGLFEKPARPPSKLANAGIYILTSNIFKEIAAVRKSPRGEIELTDAFLRLAKQTRGVYAVRLKAGECLDVGNPWDLLTVNERHLRRVKAKVAGQVDRGARLVGPVVVETGARVMSGAYVEGPVVIGGGSQVGPNCYIRPCTSLGRNVKVGNGCEVKNSIIMDGSKVPHLSYVGDSFIGENCNLGAGTITANIRFDKRTVRVRVGGKLVDSGRRKLSAFLGDAVQTGINVNLMPGVKVGSNSRIGAGVTVYRDVPSNTKVTLKQQLTFEKLETEG